MFYCIIPKLFNKLDLAKMASQDEREGRGYKPNMLYVIR